jgi:hypothetical protein
MDGSAPAQAASARTSYSEWPNKNVGKWPLEANMTPKREPSNKLLDKHAKFLAAWEAAGFPDKFESDGTSLNNIRPTAEWYKAQKKKAAGAKPS